MNAIVRIEDGICLNVMIDGDGDLSRRLCQRARIGADQVRVRARDQGRSLTGTRKVDIVQSLGL